MRRAPKSPTLQGTLMNLTYQIKAADGQIFGPASVEDVKQWIGEGRVDANSQMCRSDQQLWVTARELPELGLNSSASAPTAPPPPPPPSHPAATPVPASVGAQLSSAMDDGSVFDPQIRSGANWFYWIAGLSLANALIGALGMNWGFALGLAVTGFFDAIGESIGGDGAAGNWLGFALQLIPIGATAALGYFAGLKRQRWAFGVGMVGFALDGLLYLLAIEIVGIVIHAYALFAMFKGFRACGERAEYLKGKGLPT